MQKKLFSAWLVWKRENVAVCISQFCAKRTVGLDDLRGLFQT